MSVKNFIAAAGMVLGVSAPAYADTTRAFSLLTNQYPGVGDTARDITCGVTNSKANIIYVAPINPSARAEIIGYLTEGHYSACRM